MKSGWLSSACGVKVEHVPCPHPGAKVDLSAPPAGIGHTIEGSLEGGLAVFKQHFAPTFSVGGRRILQHIPLGFMAAAVEHTRNPPTNGWARVQIELAGHSQESLWLPDASSLETFCRLLAALSMPNVAGIPLVRPFPTPLPSRTWAIETNPRRLSGKWGREAGWFMHLEIPENSHWDMGNLNWPKVLGRAQTIRAQYVGVKHPTPRPLPRPGAVPAVLWHWVRRHGLPYWEPVGTP
jgi:hypothetical protein